MISNQTQRIAVVGIDGCGKSLVISRMRAVISEDTSFEAISCPDFHENANAPMYTLSKQLKALSDAADAIGDPVIKASALYLRMTLYGPGLDPAGWTRLILVSDQGKREDLTRWQRKITPKSSAATQSSCTATPAARP